ncbi:type III secretion system outer membrane ring subunit SctC [Erwinia piriflorinigrans]|uniref:Type 3 secretion system secretin n=1 Tax=Erwinia piriflorinigrans CFBP 5888 TaxID=1161919 RepID=V5Z746_9GAMM|nr:type III secretion system outer membrane ring subunit SctC [Erwinia piriflorinigrans]CCG87063.1 Protein invG [Erwinia piriflorinigrans CFBP 5888]
MNEQQTKKLSFIFFSLLFFLLNCNVASAKFDDNERGGISTTRDADNIYVASDNSVQQLFYVMAGEFHRPIIVSRQAAKKRVTGNFDLNEPQELLSKLASRIGLIWYNDGSSIYVYDANEIKSTVIRLSYAPFERLVAYLKSSELYDVRFPLRSDGASGSFYISGPPVYVQLVTAAAKYIDASYSRPGAGETTVRVIKLTNTFVNDRNYTQRDTSITIPGVASVLKKLMNNSSKVSSMGGASIIINEDSVNEKRVTARTPKVNPTELWPDFNDAESANSNDDSSPSGNESVNIVAYTDTNSLLVMGSERQVSFVEDLVQAIDVSKRQIQLSLWIIDISKKEINELGVKWSAAGKVNNSGVTFNTSSLTPENSIHFLADVSALVKSGSAQVISRPEILTQENVPALFDNNSSIYAKLIGERTSSLEKITYGTMISVLPRLASRQQEIEMILNIHDGTIPLNSEGQSGNFDSMPVISNTQISTEARVPLGHSLLVGGYSRDQDENHSIGIPLLRDIPYLGRIFDYSYKSQTKMVRLFLIHPELLEDGERWRGHRNDDPVLGVSSEGKEQTLKSTVSMLREIMNKK